MQNKLQIKALNKARADFAKESCEKAGLTQTKTNKVMASVSYDHPFVGIEVFKTGKVYETAKNSAQKIVDLVNKGLEDN